MAELARGAVFVPSAAFDPDVLPAVGSRGAGGAQSLSAVLGRCGTVGFQATHFAQAVAICGKMLRPQLPSPQPQQPTDGDNAAGLLVQPTLFLGATANLFGTGCREAIRFLCAECVPLPDGVVPAVQPDETRPPAEDEDVTSRLSFAPRALVHALVVSGGALEHDIRRACEPYSLGNYTSERRVASTQHQKEEHETATASETGVRFGNIMYGAEDGESTSCLFTAVMRRLVARLVKLQQQCKEKAATKPIPMVYDDVCSWALSPSTVWCLAGRWLVELFMEALVEIRGREEEAIVKSEAQRRAETTVLYWAAKNDVPIFSPSFVDGDIMQFVLEAGTSTMPPLKLDLVMDIHRINRYAMRSLRTGMILLGGGVVKHHVCNANLMRNGADYTVFINNGQEFDGSDAGARPDEAISWGKIRLDGDHVKVYAEVSLVFPLLVAQVFLPWVRAARGLAHAEKGDSVSRDFL